MAELQEDIISEGQSPEEGPKPKPKLADAHRAKLDSIVSQMIANKESDENINAVVEDFKTKYAAPEQKPFQVQISEPTFKSEPFKTGAREFTYEQPVKPLGVQQLRGKAQKAQDAIQKEIEGNSDVKVGMVKHRTPLQKMQDQSVPVTSDMPKSRSAQDVSRLGLEAPMKKPSADVITNEEDLKTANDYIAYDRNNASEYLNEVSRKYPEKAKEIQKNTYVVDAFNSAANDPDGAERINKIEENAKAIEKGDLLYDHKNQILIKPEGFFSSLFEARKELNRISDAYDRTKSMQDNGNEAGIISELNASLRDEPDEPKRLPQGMLGELGHMIGGQTIKGLAAGSAAAAGTTLLGNPEAAGAAFQLASGAMNAVDMYKVGKQNALEQNYKRIKLEHPEIPDYDAYTQANDLAEKQAVTDAAAAGAMQYFGAKVGFGAAKQLSKGLSSGLSQIKDELGKRAFEAAGIGGIGSASQVVKNIMAQRGGLETPTSEGALDAFKSGVLMTGAMAMLGVAFDQLKPATRNRLSYGLGQMPDEAINNGLNKLEQSGQLTAEQTENVRNIILEQKAFEKLIPDDLPEADRLKIGAKIKERSELKQRLEQIDEAFHPEIKEKIKKLNEEIIGISKGGDRGELQKLVQKAIAGNEINESASEPLSHASEGELSRYMKEIASQAHDPNTQADAVAMFGENIVNKAKEMYPDRTGKSKLEIIEEDRAQDLKKIDEKIEAAIKETYPTSKKVEYLKRDRNDINSYYDNQISSLPKTEENASTIRSNEGQVSLDGRPEPASGQEQGGGDIQLEESAKPISAEAEQQAGNEQQGQDQAAGEKVAGDKMNGGIPPDMGDLPFTPEAGDVGRLAHADTESLYRELGMSDRIPRATKEDLTLENEADNLIKSGYDFEGKADRVLSGRDKSFTDVEQVAFAKMVGSLNVKLQKLEVNSPDFNSTLETIERLSRASDKVGSEEGAAFRARRMFMLNDETLSSYMQRAKEANLDVPLTEQQAEAVKAHFDELVATKEAYRARVEKLAAENAKLKAEGAVKKVQSEVKASKPKTETKRTHDDYVKERQDIVAKMREDLLKAAKGGGGAMSSIPGAAQLVAVAPHVAKLLKSLVEEGIEKLPELIKNIHEQIKEVVPGITEKNVHDIIAGEYNKKQTSSDLKEKIYNMHLQAKLINRLESLKAGIQPKSNRQRLIRSAEIEDLRKQIKELSERPEKTEAEKLAALKARYKSQTEKLQKKIDAGDFEPDEKEVVALDKEATELKDAYIKKKIEWQKRVANDAFKNRSLKQQGKDFAAEILGIPRTVMSSMDLSAPLRQGLVLTASHPFVASKAFAESLKQAVDPARFDRWLYDLKESDYYKNVIEKSGLYIADPNNLSLSAKEEAYMSNLAEKIPIIGDTIKNKEGKTIVPGLGLISKSERAYVSYLNKLRVDVFTMYAKGFAEKGMTPETRPDVYEALGAFINAATGRGELGDLERSAPILNAVFFSPRLIASRINMLNPVWYASLPKEVRIMALKDMAKTIGIGATTVGLFSLVPGVTVEKDPRSPDFGKIKVGNTRWDVWGGFQQYVRLASQLISGSEKKASGNIVPLGPGRNEHTKADKFFSFFRGKLSPIPSILVDYGVGKTAVGEDVELTSEMKEHLIPMIGNDVADAWKEQGPMSMVYTGVPSFLGVGTTTYKEKEAGTSHGKSGKSAGHSKHSKNSKNKK